MKIKKITLLTATLLLSAFFISKYFYAQDVTKKLALVKKAKTVGPRAKRYQALVDEIEKEIKAGKVVPKNILDETRKIEKKYTYRYKTNILDQAEEMLKKPILILPEEEPLPEPPEARPAPARPELPEARPAEVREEPPVNLDNLPLIERLFYNIFQKTVDQVLADLQIPNNLKSKYKKIALAIVEKIRDGRKIYPGPDTGKIITAKKRSPQKSYKTIMEELYKPEMIAKLAGYARNRLVDELLDEYTEKDLKDVNQQLEYQKKLRESLPEKGYNIEKIPFLMTREEIVSPTGPGLMAPPPGPGPTDLSRLSMDDLKKERGGIGEKLVAARMNLSNYDGPIARRELTEEQQVRVDQLRKEIEELQAKIEGIVEEIRRRRAS